MSRREARQRVEPGRIRLRDGDTAVDVDGDAGNAVALAVDGAEAVGLAAKGSAPGERGVDA